MFISKIRIIAVILFCLLFCGCSSKKNTAATRQWRAFTTRYNIYFNGNEAYKEALANFEKNYEDDYSERIYQHPVSSLTDKAEGANAGFDRAIEKSQKAIKLRSMPKRPPKNARKADDPNYKAFLKRTEFNPFLHNAWLMMGRSQFYKGDFLAANATFLYITRHFGWLPETVTESMLWMAHCYTELGWMYEAENTLSKVDAQTVPKSLKNRYSTVMSAYLIRKGETREAIPHLEIALKAENNKSQKARMKFLLAQLYAENGDPAKAYKYYGEVMKMNPSYRTYFNAGIKQTEVMPASNTQKIEKKLNRMLRDPRNKEYLDQIHYAKGNLFLGRKDTLKAIEAYEKAVAESTRNGMDKAVAAIRLGDLTFSREEYLKAQPAYASAMSILNEKHRDHRRIAHLSQVLDNLSTHAETVHLQDSLLALAQMSEPERMKAIQAVIDRIIEEEKKAEEAARREEYENNKGNYTQPDNNIPSAPSINTGDNSWYFFNKMSVNAGKTEFQRRWGARKPEDNWRRRDKSHVFSEEEEKEDVALTDDKTPDDESPTADIEETNDNEANDPNANDPKNPDYYLKQIPFSAEDQANANDLIREGLYNMGIIINQQLENLPLAIKTFLDLEKRYPDNDHSLDIYYEVYLMYMRMQDEANAETYKQLILQKYPQSAYAVALSDPNHIRNLREMEQKQNELYEQTYAAYLEGNSSLVHRNYEFVLKKWPLSKLMPNFLFLHALSYVGESDGSLFRENLEKLTALYGESFMAPLAGQMLKGIAQGKMIASGGKPMQGMIWKTRLNSSLADELANDSLMPVFELKQDAPHLLVLAFQTDSVQVNQLLFDIAKYNFTNFLVKDFDLETITFNELSMLVIKGFDRFEELSEYRLRMALPGGLSLPASVTPVMISDANFRLLLEGRTFDDYFSFMEQCSEAELSKE
ncbi:MAG: tetratricopeptide repeat protein [Bacteroidales bacterium]